MWTETTSLHPDAWSDKVEADLRRTVLMHRFHLGALPHGEIHYRLEDEPEGFAAAFDAAAASAREQLANATVHQNVTLSSDGTATLSPMVVRTAEEYAAHEAAHAALRAMAVDRASRQAEWDAAVQAHYESDLQRLAGA